MVEQRYVKVGALNEFRVEVTKADGGFTGRLPYCIAYRATHEETEEKIECREAHGNTLAEMLSDCAQAIQEWLAKLSKL